MWAPILALPFGISAVLDESLCRLNKFVMVFLCEDTDSHGFGDHGHMYPRAANILGAMIDRIITESAL